MVYLTSSVIISIVYVTINHEAKGDAAIYDDASMTQFLRTWVARTEEMAANVS